MLSDRPPSVINYKLLTPEKQKPSKGQVVPERQQFGVQVAFPVQHPWHSKTCVTFVNLCKQFTIARDFPPCLAANTMFCALFAVQKDDLSTIFNPELFSMREAVEMFDLLQINNWDKNWWQRSRSAVEERMHDKAGVMRHWRGLSAGTQKRTQEQTKEKKKNQQRTDKIPW